MSLRGVAVTALAVAGGPALLPAAAFAQEAPGAAAGAAPETLAQVAPAQPEKDPAAAACAAPGKERDGEEAEAVVPAPPPEAEAAAAGEPPVATCSQDAGDQQYRDPFANSEPPSQGGNGGNGSSPDQPVQSPAQTAPVTPTDDSVAPTAQTSQTTTEQEESGSTTANGKQLANTGLGLAGLLALGLALLAGGLALQRRIA